MLRAFGTLACDTSCEVLRVSCAVTLSGRIVDGSVCCTAVHAVCCLAFALAFPCAVAPSVVVVLRVVGCA